MKLNNKGWGYKEMIIMSSILFILLLIVAYYVYSLYNKMDVKVASVYANLELKLQNAAVEYNSLYMDKSYISLDELKEKKLIVFFTDNNDNACDGYVLISESDYTPYISCQNYTSKNYYNYKQ